MHFKLFIVYFDSQLNNSTGNSWIEVPDNVIDHFSFLMKSFINEFNISDVFYVLCNIISVVSGSTTDDLIFIDGKGSEQHDRRQSGIFDSFNGHVI